MTESRVIMACAARQVHWYLDAEPAKCTDLDHCHRRVEVHRHRDVISLPDGTEVTAVSFEAVDPYARDRQPDYGLYLDCRWQPPWLHDHLDWPDFGVPSNPALVVTTLRSVIDRARAGEQVEVGCLGGHGRTGTALACLAVLAGHPAAAAVAWVRANYCSKAIETAAQETFITRLPGLAHVHGFRLGPSG
jgi:protein-tyrosine phosphatase